MVTYLLNFWEENKSIVAESFKIRLILYNLSLWVLPGGGKSSALYEIGRVTTGPRGWTGAYSFQRLRFIVRWSTGALACFCHFWWCFFVAIWLALWLEWLVRGLISLPPWSTGPWGLGSCCETVAAWGSVRRQAAKFWNWWPRNPSKVC